MKIFNLQFLFAIAMVLFFMGEITAAPVERILIAGRRVQRSVDVDGDERILAARIAGAQRRRRSVDVDGADRILAMKGKGGPSRGG